MASSMHVSGYGCFNGNMRRPSFSRRTKISSCLNVKSLPPNGLENAKRHSTMEMQTMEDEKKFIVGTYARSPVVIVSGNGCTVKDLEGREYLDLTSGVAVNALGHSHPDWVSSVVEQANTLTHCSNIFYSLPQIELAKLLVRSSFADKVFFCNSGAEANEAAIKFSRKFQNGATQFISFGNSFHGRTMGSLALTSKEQYRAPFEPLMPGVTFLEYGDTEAVRQAVIPGKTAAVFVEPIQGEGGIHCATREFLHCLRSLCDESGVLLVFDEVQCGLGRTGRLWAHEAYDVYPDIMTLAKPLAGGLPIGAVLLSDRVAGAIGHGDHGSTFAGSPLVCHAALSVMRKVAHPEFLDDVAKKGMLLKGMLEEKVGDNAHVKEIRGVGLIVGIELDVSAGPLVDACREAGLLVLTAGKGNVVRLVPPLVITQRELRHAVAVIQSALHVLD